MFCFPKSRINKIEGNGLDSSDLAQKVEFSATFSNFCTSKLSVPTTLNTDFCSLGLVHYADNSHFFIRGATYAKKSVLLEAMSAKMAKTLLKG